MTPNGLDFSFLFFLDTVQLRQRRHAFPPVLSAVSHRTGGAVRTDSVPCTGQPSEAWRRQQGIDRCRKEADRGPA